jgi:DnaJ-class molecular chaperone
MLTDATKIYTEPCPSCHGAKYEPGSLIDCHGAGVPCARCNGSGEVNWRICSTCEGFDPVGCPECEGEVRIDL